VKKEAIAVKEARRLGIPVAAIVDTNTDPELIDYPVPANDDALKSVQLITRTIADAVLEGNQRAASVRAEQAMMEGAEKKEETEKPRVEERRH
ncbi:MAG: 30S ribosomal protein S2, partial [Bacteroidota bacterium]